MNIQSNGISISRNVVFYDLEFPYRSPIHNTQNDLYTDQLIELHTAQPEDIPIPCTIANPVTFREPDSPIPNSTQTNSHPPNTRHSTRVKTVPTYLDDYVCYLADASPYPLSSHLSYTNLSPTHLTYALSLTSETEPSSFTVANKDDRWVAAMSAEIDALHANKTWEFTDLPYGVTPIGSEWVYKIKRQADGTVEHFKARLAAQGFMQT